MKKEPEAKGNNKVSPNKDIQQEGASAYNRKGSRHAANKIEEKSAGKWPQWSKKNTGRSTINDNFW